MSVLLGRIQVVQSQQQLLADLYSMLNRFD